MKSAYRVYEMCLALKEGIEGDAFGRDYREAQSVGE